MGSTIASRRVRSAMPFSVWAARRAGSLACSARQRRTACRTGQSSLLDHCADDLAIHGLMQAAAIGRRVRRRLVFGLRDLAVEPAARQFGIERLLLFLHLLVALGDGGEVIAQPLGILHPLPVSSRRWATERGMMCTIQVFPAQLALEKGEAPTITALPDCRPPELGLLVGS